MLESEGNFSNLDLVVGNSMYIEMGNSVVL